MARIISKKSNFAKLFQARKSNYEKLGANVKQALETFLIENNISILHIQHRVKHIDSFLEKIEKKGYEKPFDEIEDICGVRIICYYQSDIARIKRIIEEEFIIVDNEDKKDLLQTNEFGYRSMHFIAQIKHEWTQAPNYRGLDELKFEVQLRTILMHSWAEIEHKLAYKSELQIPNDLKRKFSRISAKLEEADEQFEEIKDAIEINKEKLIETASKENKFDIETELNLDSLQAFLDFSFPQRLSDIKETSELLNEMHEFSISFKDLILGFEKHKENLVEIEKESIKRDEAAYDIKYENEIMWWQSGAARTILELISSDYLDSRRGNPDIDIIKKYR